MNNSDKSLFKEVVRNIFQKIFWGEYNYSEEEFISILSDASRQEERFFVFQKAFFNLKEPAILTKIFSEEEIKNYLKKLIIPQRFSYISERIKIWRNVFLGEKNEIPRAKWRFV